MQFQQKQPKSDEDEFELASTEIETYLKAPSLTPYLKTNHPRTKAISEKQKLGLIVTPALTEAQYSSNPHKMPLIPQGKILKVGSATFRSNFESGNIGSVELVGINTFKISLDLQSNSGRGNTWFFFTVEGVKGEAHFIINGFTKKVSLYNQGMKICFRDNKEAVSWRRGGTRISYEPSSLDEQERKYTLKFTFFFKTNEYSSVDFAYSFPYSYQKLTNFIHLLQPKAKSSVLCSSYDGRKVPLLTIGNPNSSQLIVISARAHPGQTGSSFIVEGFLKELISSSEIACFLLPMINIDGVCRGNYRFSAAGVDLNRKWKQPSQQYHPQIYYLKQMILKESKQRQLKMYIDFHGHSRKKNVFFYGCCPNQVGQQAAKAKVFPYLMSKIHGAFSYGDCCFKVQKDKEGTARVTLFRQFKINQIYTCEASFCGPMGGPNFSQTEYQKMGRKVCEGIASYFTTSSDSHYLISKLQILKEESLKELEQSPYLLKVGNNSDSGSQSEPQKGEIIAGKIKNSISNQEFPRKRGLNSQTACNYARTPKIPTSLKQKSEASIGIFEDRTEKEKDPYIYLLQAPTQLFQADFKSKVQSLNKRVHSTAKKSQYQKPSRQGLYEDQFYSIEHERNRRQKAKVNLMIGRQGAQYRRVRKMAQQSLKQQSSELEVKGIKGNKIQMEIHNSTSKGNVMDKTKYRRTSAEMFFRKPTKTEQKMEISKNEINVLCRGKQIFFDDLSSLLLFFLYFYHDIPSS